MVVLTHGENDSYADVVADLLEAEVPAVDICVVHNPVTPADREIRPARAGIEVLRMSGNRGYAVGMNAGMRHQLERGADWVWLLTHDVRLRPGAVAALSRSAQSADGYGALGPVLALRESEGFFSHGGLRSRYGGTFHARSDLATRAPGPDGITEIVWLDGSAILLRAQALRAVGGYDETLYGYSEDAELCLRLERAGWRSGVVADAVATQVTGHQSRPGAVAYLLTRNKFRYRWLVAGRRGVLDGLKHQPREAVHNVRMVVDPRSPWHVRRFYFARAVGTWAGVGAFLLRRRSGPPPAWLPGLGEMGRGSTRARQPSAPG